jgi:hypothetical protein
VKLSRKIMMATGALVLPLATVAMIGGTASAARSHTSTVGQITCTGIKGTITFKPPLINGGTATETSQLVKITVTKCKASGGTPTVPKKGKVSSNLASGSGTNSCASLTGGGPPSPETLVVAWSPGSLGHSTSAYSGYNIVTNGAGDDGFQLPNTGGTGQTTGSYSETMGSTAEAFSNQTASTLGAECAAKGIAKLTIKSGNTTL